MKRDKYDYRDFSFEWGRIRGGKQDHEVSGSVSYKGKVIGPVRVTISKFRADWLNYSADDMIKYAERRVITGINSGRYKELRDGIKA